jgi:diaminohydroxyphosphoribosylaminopyrimidine deaminase/5-amino-6-(5-phosphoribosylamino)uracil reductase
VTDARSSGAAAYSACAALRGGKWAEEDGYFMDVALSLARYGEPAPNPAVGAIVVRHGEIVGSGYHARAGEAHAEVIALKSAGLLTAGATLYVTLEPCNHFGRTPPCVDAIERSRVKRVVIGCADPNGFVRGGGANRLRELGVEVVVSVRAEEAAELIAPWLQALGRMHGA